MAFKLLSQNDFDEIFEGKDCFCGSGASYEVCHREKKYRNPKEIALDQNRFMHRSRRCPVVTEGRNCEKPVIASHSQQRRGPLKLLTENGHVLGFSGGPNAGPRGESTPELTKISARKASTFPGLCAEHDAQLFRDIENQELKPNYKTALGLARRNTLYEAVVHTDATLFLNWLQTVPTFDFQMNTAGFTAELDNMRHYAAYNWYLATLISKIETRKSARKLYFFIAKIDACLPMSATGCFCIENDLDGVKLQKFSDTKRKFSYAQISVLPQGNGTTIFSISSTNDRDMHTSRKFLESFARCGAEELSNAILRTALEYTENIYFKESWVKTLSETQRNSLCKRFDDAAYFKVGLEKPDFSLARPLDIQLEGKVVASLLNTN